jgi:hypothetical protein
MRYTTRADLQQARRGALFSVGQSHDELRASLDGKHIIIATNAPIFDHANFRLTAFAQSTHGEVSFDWQEA